MNVKFLSVKLKSTFDALETKDNLALYWIDETQELYKGSKLYGTGALATEKAAGLLSPEDYAALKALIAGGGSSTNSTLTAVDGTIQITDTADGGKAIGVLIAQDANNVLQAVEGGLFVPAAVVPEYAIEKQAVAAEGFSATYKLKKTTGDEVTYVGDEINIAKDLVLKAATLQTVVMDGVPFEGAVVGDPYIDMEFNDATSTHLYISMKDLVDTYTAGDGIEIVDGQISVKLAAEAHGLVAVDGTLMLNLATRTSDGAMSKEDKLVIDSIPSVYMAKKYEIRESKPIGTLVDYREKEIRILCPADTKWTAQNVGANGDASQYYVGFRAYAPAGAVSFKEDIAKTIGDDTMYYFDGNEFAGVDEFGRSYSIVWLAVAKLENGVWSYYGVNSDEDHMIGFDYSVEWYDASGVKIDTDTIRINLSNETCHTAAKPFYMEGVATDADIEALREEMDMTMSWGEL